MAHAFHGNHGVYNMTPCKNIAQSLKHLIIHHKCYRSSLAIGVCSVCVEGRGWGGKCPWKIQNMRKLWKVFWGRTLRPPAGALHLWSSQTFPRNFAPPHPRPQKPITCPLPFPMFSPPRLPLLWKFIFSIKIRRMFRGSISVDFRKY